MKKDLSRLSKELIYLLDPKDSILEVSPSVHYLLGFQPNELIEKSLTYLWHTDDIDKFSRSSLLLKKSEKSENSIQHRIRNRSNQYLWFQTHLSFLKDERDGVERLLCNSFIISEIKLEENFVLVLKRKYGFLSEHSQDIVSIHDLEGTFVYVNPAYEKFTGFLSKELMGKNGFDRVHPDDVEFVKENTLALNLNGESSLIEWRFRKRDNSYIWLETRASVIPDNFGAPFQIFCSSKDITESIKANQKLKESQQRHRALFDSNPDAVFIMDLQGVITDVNEAAARLIQVPKDQIINAPFIELTRPDERDMYIGLFQEAKKGITKNTFLETIILNGTKLVVDITNIPIEVDGEIIGVSSIVKDVTEIIKLQKEKELIYLISLHIDKDDGLKTALDNIIEKICNYTGSILGEVWLPGSNKQFMKLQNFYFKDNPKIEKFVRSSKSIKIKPGEGISGYTWKTRHTSWHENILREPFFIRKQNAEIAGIKSCISVPIILKKECLAVITLFFDYNKNEDAYILEFMDTVSNHLASELSRRKSTEELNLFFEISSDLLSIVGFDGYYKKINNSFADVLGYSIEEILENTIYSFIHPEDIDATQLEIKGLEGGEPVQYFENRMMCKDGSFKWFEWKAQPLHDQEVFFCIGRDISYQKSREEELLRIKLAVEGTHDAIAILGKDRMPLYHNKAYIDIIGYTPEELIYIGGPAAIYADRREYDKIHKKLSKDQPFEGDIQLINKKREIIDFNIRANVIYDNLQQIMGLLIIFTNISERIKMEKKIQQEKYFAESTINALPGIFYMIDDKGNFRRWNKNFETITGYNPQEIIKMKPLDLFPIVEKDDVALTIKEVFEKGKAFMEATLILKNGEAIPYYITGTLTQVNNEPFLLGFGIDITERKVAEEQLKEAHKALAQKAEELVASNEELENFAYIASHDLQEPLRMITGFLQLLKNKYKDSLDEDGQKYIQFVIDGADRMKDLINDLLEYSKIGTSMAANTDVDLNEVIAEMKTIFMSKIDENNIRLICDNLPHIKGIKIQITQLFQNLIGNAIKYRSHNDPIIVIKVEDKKNKWVFSIADNGIGIAQKYYEKIFIIFKRLHNRKGYTGTGLGLAICKKIIERHGGQIWVDSVEAQGSTFYFALPK